MLKILFCCTIALVAWLPLDGVARPHNRPMTQRPTPDIPQSPCGEPTTQGQLLYPKKALQNGVTGWVVVEFDLEPEGVPVNAHVVDSSPKGVFEQSALDSLVMSSFGPSEAMREQCQKLYVFSVGRWDQ